MPQEPATERVAPPAEGEAGLLAALRRGDEAAFLDLVERYQAGLLRLASIYLSNPRVAEEVVQDTWLGVLRGLDRFEGRASLKTWIFRILVNTAKTRGVRESRVIPFSALEDPATDSDGSSIPAERFLPPDHPRWPYHWASPPQPWNTSPEKMLLSAETRAYIERAVQALRPSQREVITLRDIQGLTSTEVCNVLGISETNQRVLLHRARSKVRSALERYFTGEPGG
jgi:RNA polymerase sigma-70 factor (ECF subfamily)